MTLIGWLALAFEGLTLGRICQAYLAARGLYARHSRKSKRVVLCRMPKAKACSQCFGRGFVEVNPSCSVGQESDEPLSRVPCPKCNPSGAVSSSEG